MIRWWCMVGSGAVVLAAGCANKEPEEASVAAEAPLAPPAAAASDAESDAVAQKAVARPKADLSEKKFGEAITVADLTPLADVLAAPEKFADKTIRTEGMVTAVCKSMGCWMELSDEREQAHITMASHSFFVPKDADGHRAVVQGTVTPGQPEDQCGNKDGCYENAGKATGKVAKLEIVATGVEFID